MKDLSSQWAALAEKYDQVWTLEKQLGAGVSAQFASVARGGAVNPPDLLLEDLEAISRRRAEIERQMDEFLTRYGQAA